MINVVAKKISVLVPLDDKRAELHSGWGLMREDGMLFAPGGIRPYCVRTKRAAKEVEASGLLDGAEFAAFRSA